MIKSEILLEIKNLSVEYKTDLGKKIALSDFTLNLMKGEVLGLLGESGAGKSSVGMAILHLIEPPNVLKGEIIFNGQQILSLKGFKLLNYRWKSVSMIFQAAMNILDPVLKIKDSFSQILLDKRVFTKKKEAEDYSLKLLRMVGLPDTVMRMRPFELSGGMKQRVVIAMAISTNPSIVIADEITTALDVITQFNILTMLQNLKKERKIGSLILISHDLSVQLMMSDRIIVMYKGNSIEEGTTNEVFYEPLHPYTQTLIKSRSAVDHPSRKDPMIFANRIEQEHCSFVELCQFAKDLCFQRSPEFIKKSETHKVRCFLYEGVD